MNHFEIPLGDEQMAGIDSRCVQCGDDNDLMVAFSRWKVCGKCAKKNHRDAVAGRRRVAVRGKR